MQTAPKAPGTCATDYCLLPDGPEYAAWPTEQECTEGKLFRRCECIACQTRREEEAAEDAAVDTRYPVGGY